MSNSGTRNESLNALKATEQSTHQLEQTRLPRRGHVGGVRHVPVKSFKAGRKRFIKIRVNDNEHAALSQLGKKEGGISELVRRHLLGQAVEDARREALRELARLARNFSLIAVETRRYQPARAMEIIGWLMVVERELKEAIQRIEKRGA